jgi:hypothetical protein
LTVGCSFEFAVGVSISFCIMHFLFKTGQSRPTSLYKRAYSAILGRHNFSRKYPKICLFSRSIR